VSIASLLRFTRSVIDENFGATSETIIGLDTCLDLRFDCLKLALNMFEAVFVLLFEQRY
jgi:hypothetical protein